MVYNGNDETDSLTPQNVDSTDISQSDSSAPEERTPPAAIVRYGFMNFVGEFKYKNKDTLPRCGCSVIVQTHRGIEMGKLIAGTGGSCDRNLTAEQIARFVTESGQEYFHFDNGRILRLASEEDLADWEHICSEVEKKTAFCQKCADEQKLEMKVLAGEHLFGGERIIFYFLADGRIDFRALVKGLAEEFQTRIEMRQVGARDEARLLADFETCGRECCCKNFLKALKPINMRMAKMQKATLDPAKVSGRCGRLKCCLRFEHAAYEELDHKLPRMGARVVAEAGSGKVIARHILTQMVQVQTEDGGRLIIPVEAILDEAAIARKEAEKKKLQLQEAEKKKEEIQDSRERQKSSRKTGSGKNKRSRRKKKSSTGRPEQPLGENKKTSTQQGKTRRSPQPRSNDEPDSKAATEKQPNNKDKKDITKRKRKRRGRRNNPKKEQKNE